MNLPIFLSLCLLSPNINRHNKSRKTKPNTYNKIICIPPLRSSTLPSIPNNPCGLSAISPPLSRALPRRLALSSKHVYAERLTRSLTHRQMSRTYNPPMGRCPQHCTYPCAFRAAPCCAQWCSVQICFS